MPFRNLSISLLILANVLVPAGLAWGGGAGTTSANFLKVAAGARAAAMGEAFTAVSNDGEAIAWNVAGLSQMMAKEINLMHTEWLQGYKYEFVSYSQNLGGNQGIGVSIVDMHLDDFSVIREKAPDNPGDFIGAVPVITQEGVTVSHLAATLAYSRPLAPGTYAGAGLKFIQETLDDTIKSGFAADLGYFYANYKNGWSLGATVQNIGPSFQGYPLPMTVRVGGAQRVRHSQIEELYTSRDVAPSKRRDLLFSMDLSSVPSEGSLCTYMGCENRFVMGNQYLALRGGWKLDFSKNGESHFSVGLGYVLATSFVELGLDYAWTPYSVLGDSHRVAGTIRY